MLMLILTATFMYYFGCLRYIREMLYDSCVGMFLDVQREVGGFSIPIGKFLFFLLFFYRSLELAPHRFPIFIAQSFFRSCPSDTCLSSQVGYVWFLLYTFLKCKFMADTGELTSFVLILLHPSFTNSSSVVPSESNI